MTEPRRFVQIQYASNGHYVAVADDGTAWEIKRRDYSWIQLPALPHHVARRPKLPSLAEEALTKIDAILGDPQKSTLKDELEALELSRAALERLKELEGAND